MEKTKIKYKAQLSAALKEHPYLCAAAYCIALEAFTLGDEKNISAQSVMIASVLFAAALYFLLGRLAGKFRIPAAFGCAVVAALWGVCFVHIERKGGTVAALTAAAAAAFAIYLYKTKKFTPDNARRLIIFLSFGLYSAYVLYTLSYMRQTDVSYWNSQGGHAPYIKYYYEHYFMLPDFDPREVWQFYHTPLFYYICAAALRAVTVFGVDFEQATEVTQIVTLFSAMSIVITSEKIFRIFGLKDLSLTIAVGIAAMSNTILMLSGSISNDVTAAAFEIAALYLALKWYESRSMKGILFCALCMGLGLMSKLSAWMAAPPIAFIFILAFIRDIRSKKLSCRIFGQFGAFLGVSVPLGMWFPVYNLVRWGVPLGFIPQGGINMFVGEHSIPERLFTASPAALSTPFMLPKNYLEEYNPIVALMKSSADLQRLGSYETLAPLLSATIIITSVIAAASLVCMFICPFAKKRVCRREYDIFMLIFYLVTVGSYIVFCIKYPYTCTENVRYVIPMVSVGALYFGRIFSFEVKNDQTAKLIKTGGAVLTAFYGVLFVFTFVLLGFD